MQIEGFNPSAEEASEGTNEAVESGVDIVLNHRLSETYAFGDKKSFTAYLKEYMKKLVLISSVTSDLLCVLAVWFYTRAIFSLLWKMNI